MDSTPEASREEKSLINSSLQFADMLNLGGGIQRRNTTAGMDSNMRMSWTRLRDGDLSVKKFKKMKEGDPSAWGKASAIVHTTAEQALAFVWLYCSNSRMKEHQKNYGNLLREIYEPITTDTVTVPPAQHRTQHIVVQKSMPPPFLPRETNERFVWSEINNNNNNNHIQEDSKTLVMAFNPAEIRNLGKKKTAGSTLSKTFAQVFKQSSNSTSVHPTNNGEEEQSLGVVQLETKGVWIITPLAQNLCEVTFAVNIVDKGKIPTSLVNANIGRALNPVTFLKAFYERTGLVVDAELRVEFDKNVPRTVNLITAEQQSFVQQEMDLIDYKDDSGWEKLVKDSSVFLKLSKKHNKGESNSWGKVSERSGGGGGVRKTSIRAASEES